ncbi:MAG: DUF2127 domain-containing protein [Usitatibacter sp.]
MTGIFKTMRAIACFEGAKGAIVLLAGLGVLSLFHHDLQRIADHIVRHFHLDPASHYPQIFLRAAESTSDTRILLLAAGAAAYAAVRFVEAYGLWYARPWAEVFAAASGAVYMPFEIYRWLKDHHWHAALAFGLNLAIVWFMIYALQRRRRLTRPGNASG